MLLTEEQTKYYLNDMIKHYREKEDNTVGSFSWQEVKQSIVEKLLKI